MKQKEPNVVANFQGIKCDFCRWEDASVKYEDYPNYLNKPCPVCGANLLTEADYANCQTLMAYVQAYNEEDAAKHRGPLKRCSIEMNGTGSMVITTLSEDGIGTYGE